MSKHIGTWYKIENHGYLTPCWIWLGALDRGYGRITVFENGEKIRIRAHRLYWTRLNGPVPDGRELDHLCRIRSCVNPDHLDLVTRAENVRRGYLPTITEAIAKEIRDDLSSGLSQTKTAEKHGISQQMISKIARGVSWK